MVATNKTVRAARAREAFLARHAELREVVDHWAGMLAAAAASGGLPRVVRNLLCTFLADEVLPHARSGADLAALLAREPRLAGSQFAA